MQAIQATVLIATLVVMAANWWSRFIHDDRIERWSKPLATALVIALALVSEAPGARVAVAVVALTLCLAGDVFLMPAVDHFVAGLASFLVGHLVFVILFFQYGLNSTTLAGIAIVLAALLVASIGRVIVQGAAHADATLRIPVLAYLVVITSTAVFGWATGRGWVVAGTALFVASDSVLGWHQFVGQRRWMSPTIMITYHGAIAALALSLW